MLENNFDRNSNNRVGERRIMKCGEECEIVEYRKYNDITVRFIKTGEIIKCRYNQFIKGIIKSHFTPTLFEVGVVGVEKTTNTFGKNLKSYETWRGMLRRCYDKKILEKFPTYKRCTVCDEWLFYPNFKKWYEKNYYEIEGQKMNLDKDILLKGNKVYSPDMCVFVPTCINSLFTNRKGERGDYPIGVSWKRKNNKFQAQCSLFDAKNNKYTYTYLGLYNTSEEAFNVYKKVKEENIKLVADYYREQIPSKLYEAMYKYEVEIID